jgi:hypothetical protein
VEEHQSERSQRAAEFAHVEAYGRALSVVLETLADQIAERDNALALLARASDFHEVRTALGVADQAARMVEATLRSFDRQTPPFVCDSMHGAFVAAVDELLQMWRAEARVIEANRIHDAEVAAEHSATAQRARRLFIGWWGFFQSEHLYLVPERPDLAEAWQLTPTAQTVINTLG